MNSATVQKRSTNLQEGEKIAKKTLSKREKLFCLNYVLLRNGRDAAARSGYGSITADRETDAFVLKSWVDIEAEFCPADSSAIQYESFLPKTFFCQSHLNDGSIHVTTDEKEKWNSSITIGSYFGTDASSRSIKLGFQPKAVLVAAASLPLVYSDTSNVSHCMSAIATQNASSAGLEITSDGFRLIQGTSQNYANTYTRLNKLNVNYIYIALK